MRAILTPFFVLALAACGNPAEEADDPLVQPNASETMMPVEPDGGIGNGAGPIPTAAETVEPAPSPTPDIEQPQPIPADYHGVWDHVDGSCAPESDLRMEISADKIVFYESVGTVTSLISEPNGDRIVTLAMSGEGETWTETLRLQMDSTATRMVVLQGDTFERTAYSARKRCN